METTEEKISLTDALYILENSFSVLLANDLGIHKYCKLNSNCPRAIKVRKLMAEAGVSMEQLVKVFAEEEENFKRGGHNTDYLDELEKALEKNTVKLHILGQELELDLTEEVKQSTGFALTDRLNGVKRYRQEVESYLQSWFATYKRAIRDARLSETLPQLHFDFRDLMKNPCRYSIEGNNYCFWFDFNYQLRYIVNNSIRYELCDKDRIESYRSLLIRYQINREYSFVEIALFKPDGSKFVHYHGGSWDCWGSVKFPEKWDGTLYTLSTITKTLEKIIATVNFNSLMFDHPDGFPKVTDLIKNGTELGKEGEINVADATERPNTRPTRGWGNRWGGTVNA